VYNDELEEVTSTIEYASSIASSGQQYFIYSDNKVRLLQLQRVFDQSGQSYQIRAIDTVKQLIDNEATLTIA